MKNRMCKGIALMGALFALNGFADECKDVVLYSNGNDNGQMVESGMTFPELPEWKTNWGNLDGMEPPYIRLSGMKNLQDDWKGLLSFQSLPQHVDGGVLRLKVHATQNASFGVWLVNSSGKSNVHYVGLTANRTQSLEIPLVNLGVTGAVDVMNVGVGLFHVPQYQYTTLFIDDVGFSCVKNSIGSSSSAMSSSSFGANGDSLEYEFSNVESWSEKRDARYLPSLESNFTAAYSEQQRDSLLLRTNSDFVVDELEHLKIVNTVRATDVSPKKSRTSWYDNLYSVVRNRLRDNVVANPKQLYFEAEAIAATSDYTVIPLLVADLDYAYSACADSLCSSVQIVNAHLLEAGLPTSFVRGSKVSILLDPYFVVTKQRSLPSISVCVSGKCETLPMKGRRDLEFPSVGKQKIVVKMNRGGQTVEQNLFVEVK
ncbi:MAG: hypothetical protein IJ905_02790 [Fibrobacter sp.]|nr:hypothetical protein [Fibrobacter sp.]